jgi:Ca-activated chloride channel family protein
VPDRARIEPKVLDPRVSAPVNPVSISVRLAAGFPLGEVRSHHHAVTIDKTSEETRVIRLAEGPVPADRDFELTWTAAAAKAPPVGLFREHIGGADYLLAFVTPPAIPAAEEKREIVFVIDNSGSMGGTSMAQAKASLLYALGRLKPTDRFNVIRFDDTMDVLFGDTVPADAAHIGQARQFVEALQARGGTVMLAPMRAALSDPRAADTRALRQVVFLTDGEIGNERQLLDTIGAQRGRSRLFMVGIGSAPNTFLMTRAAEIGRGTFTHIGSVDQVESRMRELFDKLESPVVTNLSATFSGTRADVTPGLLPDLYRGEPIVIAARLSAGAGELAIKGTIGGRPWQIALPVKNAAEGKGISKLWARRKITDAEIARTLGQATPDDTDARILALGLDHHLVTRLTSLVAVERTPSRPDGARLTRADLPLNLPAGWDFDKIFGERGRPSMPHARERRADASDAHVHRAADRGRAAVRPLQPDVNAAPAQTVSLPTTATDAELRITTGFALLCLSLLVIVVRRRAGRSALVAGH